jgi:hypothetical protein
MATRTLSASATTAAGIIKGVGEPGRSAMPAANNAAAATPAPVAHAHLRRKAKCMHSGNLNAFLKNDCMLIKQVFLIWFLYQNNCRINISYGDFLIKNFSQLSCVLTTQPSYILNAISINNHLTRLLMTDEVYWACCRTISSTIVYSNIATYLNRR